LSVCFAPVADAVSDVSRGTSSNQANQSTMPFFLIANPQAARATPGPPLFRSWSSLTKRLFDNTLSLHILAATAACQILLFAALLLHNGDLVEQALAETFKQHLEDLTPLLNSTLAPLLVRGDRAALADRLEATRSDDDIVYLVLRDAQDAVVAASGWNPADVVPLASTRVINDERLYHTFLLVEANGKKYGTLNFGVSTKQLASYRDDLLRRGSVIVGAGLLLIGAVQALLAYWLTRRLRRLTAASEDVARGKYDIRLDESGSGEVARLAASLNAMTAAIRDKIFSLEQNEEHLRLAIDAGSIVPWERDLADDTFRWGPGVGKLLGPVPPGRASHPDLLTMVHAEDRDALLRARDEAIRNSSQYRCDFRIVAADGSERWLAVRGKFVRSELSPQGSLIGVARDITMGKQAELQIRRLNQELEARVRERTVELEATVGELEAFSYTISHDLRAPLRAISGFAEIVREDCSEDRAEHTRDYLARIAANAERMSRMIDDLLRFSRMARSPLQRSQVKPEQIAAELLRDLAFPEAARAEIRIHSMPACHGDPALLRQVYANLISNALKYSRDAERPLVEIGSGTGEGGNPVYFVKDNGAGFDPTYADRLFGVFQRLHKESQFEGNGVGLAITQRIIQRHGGTIWANAVPGQGATFFFTMGGPTGAHLKP